MNWREALKITDASLALLAWRLLAATAVLLFGFAIAAGVRRILSFSLRRRVVPSENSFFLPAIAGLAIVVVTIVLALVVLGVGSPVIGFIVTVGLALGLLADSLSGLRILVFRPFQIGETIEIQGENIIGRVEEITLIGTVLGTADGNQVLIPNRMLFEHPIRSHSSSRAHGVVSFEFVVTPKFGIRDLEEKIATMIESAVDRDGSSADQIVVRRIEGDSVTIGIRFSTDPHRRERTASEFLKAAELQCKEHGIIVHSLSYLHK